MARLVLNNAYVAIGAIDLSDHITSVSLNTTFELIETTVFGDTSRRRVASLADNSVSFEFHQDFASGSVESTIYPLLGTAVACEIRPVNTAVSTSNPKYTFSAVVAEWNPIGGSVGNLLTATVTWPISGDITKATS